jgi:hypothetical protein
MGYLFKKYEFTDQAEAEALIAGLPHETDEEGNEYPAHKHTIVKLGHVVVTEAEFEEGENSQIIELTPAVLADNYSVDVLWADLEEQPAEWADHEITVEGNGVHTFAGWSYN